MELPGTLRGALDRGLRNDVVTDINLRPVFFDEADRERDGRWAQLLFGIPLGDISDDELVPASTKHSKN